LEIIVFGVQMLLIKKNESMVRRGSSLKTVNVSTRLGHCVICGNRVFTDERYLKASEGYCHHKCLRAVIPM